MAVPPSGARSKTGRSPSAIVEEIVLDVWLDLESMLPRRIEGLRPAETDELKTELRRQALRALDRGSAPGPG
ncbi:MAG: hypothetical protein JKY65_13730 [Planctomycetes bacterium]|nr:hypothetical protein [Planctomycetota bacterium]